jgi:O-antigen ligase
MQALFDRFASISEDGGSGRDIVYADVWNMIKSSDYSHIIWGHGYNQVRVDAELGFSAHNDFLEMLYDFGICGLFAFCGFVASASNLRTYRRFSYPQKSALLVFVILSLFSHLVLVTSYVIPILVFWAYVPSNKLNRYNNLTSF